MKSNIEKMGTKSDLRHRTQYSRVDTAEGQQNLEKARSYMFQGFKVDGSKVGGVKGMDSESRTPTRVSYDCTNIVLD
jgi:hypothetical protein